MAALRNEPQSLLLKMRFGRGRDVEALVWYFRAGNGLKAMKSSETRDDSKLLSASTRGYGAALNVEER